MSCFSVIKKTQGTKIMLSIKKKIFHSYSHLSIKSKKSILKTLKFAQVKEFYTYNIFSEGYKKNHR